MDGKQKAGSHPKEPAADTIVPLSDVSSQHSTQTTGDTKSCIQSASTKSLNYLSLYPTNDLAIRYPSSQTPWKHHQRTLQHPSHHRNLPNLQASFHRSQERAPATPHPIKPSPSQISTQPATQHPPAGPRPDTAPITRPPPYT